MTAFLRLARLSVSVVLGLAAMIDVARADDTIDDSVQAKGTYTTTVVKDGDSQASNHTTVTDEAGNILTINYHITIQQSLNGPRFELGTLSYATFTMTYKNGTTYTTSPIPMTNIVGDPDTGTVKSFDVESEHWDPSNDHIDTGFSGNVNIQNKTAVLKAGKSSGTPNPTITSYTFDNSPKPPAPKTDKKSKKPFEINTAIDSDESIDYNSTSNILSIRGDTIVGTPLGADPILGSSISMSDYQFQGYTPDGKLAVFWGVNDGSLSIQSASQTLAQADLQVLYYDPSDNEFYGTLTNTLLAGVSPNSPFYDPGLPAISSPFFESVDDLLNSASPDFDPSALFYTTITPDVNFGALTDEFTQSGGTGADDLHFVADGVPEPSIDILLALGFAGLSFVGYRRTGAARAEPA